MGTNRVGVDLQVEKSAKGPSVCIELCTAEAGWTVDLELPRPWLSDLAGHLWKAGVDGLADALDVTVDGRALATATRAKTLSLPLTRAGVVRIGIAGHP